VLNQGSEKTKYDEFSNDSMEDNIESNDDDEYGSDTSSKLVSHFKSICYQSLEMSHADHFYIKLILCNINCTSLFCNYSSNFNYYAYAN
jgi:hypothetical protein